MSPLFPFLEQGKGKGWDGIEWNGMEWNGSGGVVPSEMAGCGAVCLPTYLSKVISVHVCTKKERDRDRDIYIWLEYCFFVTVIYRWDG